MELLKKFTKKYNYKKIMSYGNDKTYLEEFKKLR